MSSELTGKERISRQLKHQSVDRIGAFESFWFQTQRKWAAQGKITEGESMSRHFGLDLAHNWTFNLKLDPEKADVILAENDETVTLLDGNGATLRQHKKHASTPEHVDYSVKEQKDWEAVKEQLQPTKNRIFFESYKAEKKRCEEDSRFFCWAGVNVFESMHPVCGHEYMLMGMALEPEWVADMANTYADLHINLMEILISEAGKPDGMYFFEDMGFKERPFMSPDMYRELIMPAHKKTIDFAHSHDIPVIMHSCGFIEPLLPYMVEAGIDCLQAMEIKAGMDLIRIHKNFGDKIALMGGLDARLVGNNDLPGIKKELEAKISAVKDNYGFILHTDHSIPESAEYESYKYFLETGRRLGTY